MKLQILVCLSLIVLVTSLPTVHAQVPCDGTIVPKATLFVNWPQFHFDAAHSGCNPYEFVLSPATVRNLGLDWQYTPSFGSFSVQSPSVADGVVYAPAQQLSAVNARTGALLWVAGPHGTFAAPPAVVGGVVYLGWEDGSFFALKASTGDVLWQYTTGNQITASPTVANGVVYVASWDKNLYALNASTGAPLWNYATGNVIESSPAVVDGVVYIGSDDQSLYALNATSGALLWKYTANSQIDSSPAVASGMVYFASRGDGTVYGLNASTIRALSYRTGNGFLSIHL